MEVQNSDFIIIAIVTVLFWVCFYDADWKRKLMKPR
jgi:hypothetical protein